jgi:hypothetical protein
MTSVCPVAIAIKTEMIIPYWDFVDPVIQAKARLEVGDPDPNLVLVEEDAVCFLPDLLVIAEETWCVVVVVIDVHLTLHYEDYAPDLIAQLGREESEQCCPSIRLGRFDTGLSCFVLQSCVRNNLVKSAFILIVPRMRDCLPSCAFLAASQPLCLRTGRLRT